MRQWLPSLVLFLASAATLPAETVQEIYARGVRASLSGDHAIAKQLFLQVLAADPTHKAAAASLRRIALFSAVPGDLKSRIEAMIVPKIDFKKVSLNTVLDDLPKLAMQLSGGKTPLNIVRLFPKAYGDEKLITLQLSNVPMSSVLEYVSRLAGVTLKYERVAVVLRTPEATPSAVR